MCIHIQQWMFMSCTTEDVQLKINKYNLMPLKKFYDEWFGGWVHRLMASINSHDYLCTFCIFKCWKVGYLPNIVYIMRCNKKLQFHLLGYAICKVIH